MQKNSSTFTFLGWEIQEAAGKILFHYQLSHDKNTYQFTDTLIVPQLEAITTIPQPLLNALLNNILLILGISYWKLYCPKRIEIASFTLTKAQADFWNTVYTKGLGEFFYENNIDFRGLVQFPYDANKTLRPTVAKAMVGKQNRSLLPIGGGKDSIVAAELLKKAHKPFYIVTFYTGLNNSSAQQQVSQKIGMSTKVVKRLLDPQLFSLNKQKDTYNGHIPAVAIHSFVSIFLAALWDYGYVIFANEESASYGNVEYLSEMVNHQWSKSLEFETLFQGYLASFITKDIQYFSLLRPFSEIQIAKIFAGYPEYFSSFISCNRGYVMEKKGKTSWCGKCPKCAFVFLLLAAFLPKDTLLHIFGKNLFNDKELLPLYEELLGRRAFKPFECVGTPEESTLALFYAYKRGEWGKTLLMDYFIEHILPSYTNTAEVEKRLFSLSEDRIPEEFRSVILSETKNLFLE